MKSEENGVEGRKAGRSEERKFGVNNFPNAHSYVYHHGDWLIS